MRFQMRLNTFMNKYTFIEAKRLLLKQKRVVTFQSLTSDKIHEVYCTVNRDFQSGSDKILKLMNRKHDKKYYLNIIDKLKNINENIKISSDFIIGYPGETEEDFEDTIDLVNKVGFVNSYSFIYSPRPGTPASEKSVNDSTDNKYRLKKLCKIISWHLMQLFL